MTLVRVLFPQSQGDSITLNELIQWLTFLYQIFQSFNTAYEIGANWE